MIFLIKDDLQKEKYNNYLADCLWAISTGTVLNSEKWRPFTENKEQKKEKKDNRTAEEIKNDLLKGLDRLQAGEKQ